MLPLKHVIKQRLRSKSLISSNLNQCIDHAPYASLAPSSSQSTSFLISQNDVASSFKTWFVAAAQQHRHHQLPFDPLLNRIYQILSSPGDEDFSTVLTALNLPLSERLVLLFLRYGAARRDILPCLKFFDWAGRQPHFHHTRATFFAIFQILKRADLKPLVLDFLENFRRRVSNHRVRFHDMLVVGYAIAGQPQNALQAFARMRFIGLDLDSFAYHVLLNALVEKNYLNAFDIVVKQIRARGYENHITNVMVIKHLCKERKLEEAEGFLNGLVRRGEELKGPEVSFLVGALCETFRFERAVELVKQFGSSGLVSLNHAYGVWIKGLVRGGRVDEALEFFSQVKDSEAYIPSTLRYNILICRLLRENRLREVYDLLVDMNESCIPPDALTMNIVLCFFCKVGMTDVALELYDSRSEFGLSLNHLSRKYLILTLCWDGGAKEAYSVLRNSVDPSYFPDWRTFCTLANALCRECKIDEMKELLHLAVGRNIVPPTWMFEKFILALCKAGKLEDGYLLHGELKSVAAKTAYVKMIKGFVKSGRGDIASRLLVEMKGKGYKLERPCCRAVLCCLLEMDNSRGRFFNLLDMLTRYQSSCLIYNFFLDAAVLAKKPELAREVFELMQRNNIKPNSSSLICMLKAYLISGRISDALILFNVVRSQGLATKKLYVTLIVGLCKSNKVDISREYFFGMLRVGLNPSLECYEFLVQNLCSLQRYREAMDIINLSQKMGRPVSSFIGNVLLYHSLISPQLYDTCLHLRGVEEGVFSGNSALCMMIGAFSGRLRVSHNIADLERLIEKCFRLNTFTYNLLLKQVAMSDMDKARLLFARMCQRGYQPNSWTYDIMIRGFSIHGMKDEARRWLEEMFKKGFNEKNQ